MTKSFSFLFLAIVFLLSQFAGASPVKELQSLHQAPWQTLFLSNATLVCHLNESAKYEIQPQAWPSSPVKTPNVLSTFVFPTVVSLVPHVVAMVFTGWTVNNRQLGIDIYRGIRCFELGYRGLERYYDYTFNQPLTVAEHAVADSLDQSLNQDMFGYLLADIIVQSATLGMRSDLLIHHVMGLTLWGSSLSYGVLSNIIAMNTAVEILSALKGIEYAATQFFGGRQNLHNQRVLKAAYGFRIAVILGIRYPMWTYLDWPVPNDHYEELGPIGWAVYRSLNVGILALETLWFYQTVRSFHRLRFY